MMYRWLTRAALSRHRPTQVRRKLLGSALILGIFFYVTGDDESWFAFFNKRPQTELVISYQQGEGQGTGDQSQHQDKLLGVATAPTVQSGDHVRKLTPPTANKKQQDNVVSTPEKYIPAGWQTVADDNIYVYSAYLDRRDRLPILVIFGMINRNISARVRFRCIVKDFPEKSDTKERDIYESGSVHDLDGFHRNNRFVATSVSCPVGKVWDAQKSRTVTLEVIQGLKPTLVLPHQLDIKVIVHTSKESVTSQIRNKDGASVKNKVHQDQANISPNKTVVHQHNKSNRTHPVTYQKNKTNLANISVVHGNGRQLLSQGRSNDNIFLNNRVKVEPPAGLAPPGLAEKVEPPAGLAPPGLAEKVEPPAGLAPPGLAEKVEPPAGVSETGFVEFTVCVPPLHSNYSDILELVEMIEVSRMLGAARFILYDFSAGADLAPYQGYYRALGVVEVHPWRLPWGNTDTIHQQIHYFAQVVAMNDCMYRNMYRSEFISMTDLDELVVPLTFDDWGAMMKYVRPAVAYDFQCVFFRKNSPDDETMLRNPLARTFELRTLLKTKRDSKIFPHKQRSKQIIRPHFVRYFHIHFVISWLRQPPTLTRTHYLHESTALLYHYRWWNETSGNSIEDRRMHKFKKTILSRVEGVHYEVNSALINQTLKIG